MSLINLEQLRGDRLPEGKGPKLTDSYIKRLICQSANRRGLNLQSKDIPKLLVVEKRTIIKMKRFLRKVEACIEEREEKLKTRK